MLQFSASTAAPLFAYSWIMLNIPEKSVETVMVLLHSQHPIQEAGENKDLFLLGRISQPYFPSPPTQSQGSHTTNVSGFMMNNRSKLKIAFLDNL